MVECVDKRNDQFKILGLSELAPNPKQPRKIFDINELRELACSISQNGVLQPVLVRKSGDIYQIVSGERRYRACQLAGLKEIPVFIKNLDDEKTLVASLIENIQRQDLNPIEEANTLREIILEHGLTHSKLAERVGISRSALTNRLRLLQLPQSVKQMVLDNKLSPGHAKVLAGIKEPHQTIRLAKTVINEKLSVNELEKYVSKTKTEKRRGVGRKGESFMSKDLHIRAVEQSLQETLGAKVKIHQGKKRSRIEIEFYDSEDLQRVVESISRL